MAERSVAISACELQQRWLQVLKRLAVKQKPALALDVIALSCHLCLREAAKNGSRIWGLLAVMQKVALALNVIALGCHQCMCDAATMAPGFEPFGRMQKGCSGR